MMALRAGRSEIISTLQTDTKYLIHMKKIKITLLLLLILAIAQNVIAGNLLSVKLPYQEGEEVKKEGLVVLWTTGEKDVFTKMLHIYVLNAKKQGWFQDITLIVWGPSAKLLAEDEEMQEMVKQLIDTGVVLEACIWCTNQYQVTEDLKAIGIDVKGMGVPLTKYIKDSKKKVLVF